MGILVQREFTVAADDRAEFERQSREGVWENMRYNGAQMIAFGTWAFGGDGEVVVTHSVYADFDHWTATRAWGAFTTDEGRRQETAAIRAIFAGRPRLIESSRATIIDYDSALSEPAPFYRNQGDRLADLPPTFGRQSIVSETRFLLVPEAGDEFLEQSRAEVWPALADAGARLVLVGRDPLAHPDEVIVMAAYRSISEWHRLSPVGASPLPNPPARADLIRDRRTRLLMVQTDFGTPA